MLTASGARSTSTPRSHYCTQDVEQDISSASRGRPRQQKIMRRRILTRVGRTCPPERAMLDSVRVRLTVWYAGLLAVFLVGLALATYFMFWRSALERTDNNLTELSDAFLTTLRAE